ncbi:hypothetical protein EJ06DRAFT_524690 [Trichodelitschia bisporula]|uniref:Uncharacterized protein n=1 Tax=Trichodelitschia bisporula TaxID=703511 RepID=A0A6G1HKC0_9PEZI|nr:hypothetical protein EJ06DRAFT_524690 [Trichodelitschia bisporula]
MASLLQTGVPVLLLTAIMALFFNPFHLLPGVVILGTWTYICHLKDKLKNCSYPDKYQREFLERKDAHTLERQRELEDKVYRLNRQLSHECESNREALDTIDILKRQLSSGHEAQRKLEQKLDNLRGKNEVLHQRLQHHLDSSHRRIVDALQARIAELERMEETSPASIAAPPITLNQAADVNHNACQQHIKKLEGFLNNANARVEELEKEATTTASRIRG